MLILLVASVVSWYIIIKHGMLVEHDLIRAHVRALDEALKLYAQEPKTEYNLQVLTEAMAYANRLQQHVEKENNVVYPLADRGLSDDIKAKIKTVVEDLKAGKATVAADAAGVADKANIDGEL